MMVKKRTDAKLRKTVEENRKISNKRKNTYLQNTGYQHQLQNPLVKNKIKETCVERYGVENPFQSEKIIKIIKEKRTPSKEKIRIGKCKKTWLKKYGVENPLQNPLVADKIISGYKNSWHDYTLPSGKVIKLQGYEKYGLDLLFETYKEKDILYKRSKMPEIWYVGIDNKKHRYYPDFYIPKDNLIIEVKGRYTYKADLDKNLLKRKATEQKGFNFLFMIIHDKKLERFL